MHNDSGIGAIFFVIVLGGALVTVTLKDIIKFFAPPEQKKQIQATFDKWLASTGGRRGRL